MLRYIYVCVCVPPAPLGTGDTARTGSGVAALLWEDSNLSKTQMDAETQVLLTELNHPACL